MNQPTSALLSASPEQQVILRRIVAQRERLKTRYAAARQGASLTELQNNTQTPISGPLLVRLLAFARLHPWFTAAVIATAAAAGPQRLNRLGDAVLPWLGRLR